ncbi:MAG: hypothetical protein WD036_04650 [Bauldia sp.]
MKNVTITLNEDTALWARVEAAKAGKSLSRWIGEKLEVEKGAQPAYSGADNGMDRFIPAAEPTPDAPKRIERFDRPLLRKNT